MSSISTSTSAFFDRATNDIGSLRKQAETLQAQLGSGKKLTRSSDDPVAASRMRMLSRADSLSQIDETNANRALADLTLADSALSTFATYITRAKELAIQAASGTLTPEQRASVGKEIEEIHGNMIALANSRDSNGHALFGGESPGDAYAIDGAGNTTYAGTVSSGQLALGDGQFITRGLTGPEFLNFTAGGAPTDLLTAVKALGEALQGGAPDPESAARDGMTMLDTALRTVTTAQTVVGSRLNWIELTGERRTNLSELRADEGEQIGGTDLATTISQLQQTLTVLEASQASFTKLAGLSLFDLIR
jgi:flagellar hook-associated protein 3 FlgL